jgi:plastocyanin
MNRALSLLAAGFLAALALTACGKDDNTGGGKDKTEDLGKVAKISGNEADVEVLDNSFNDKAIQVKPGTKVVWTNDGQQDHDIVPVKDSGFGVGKAKFNAGDTYTYTFSTPGTYRYYCSLHGSADGGMVGAVIVK